MCMESFWSYEAEEDRHLHLKTQHKQNSESHGRPFPISDWRRPAEGHCGWEARPYDTAVLSKHSHRELEGALRSQHLWEWAARFVLSSPLWILMLSWIWGQLGEYGMLQQRQKRPGVSVVHLCTCVEIIGAYGSRNKGSLPSETSPSESLKGEGWGQ